MPRNTGNISFQVESGDIVLATWYNMPCVPQIGSRLQGRTSGNERFHISVSSVVYRHSGQDVSGVDCISIHVIGFPL